MSEVSNILSDKSDASYIVNWIYLVNSIVVGMLTIPGIFKEKYQSNIRYGFMLLTLRNTTRMLDFQQSKETMSSEQWSIKIYTQIMFVQVFISLHFFCFDVR